jgi:type IV pilus assembly protein PilA
MRGAVATDTGTAHRSLPSKEIPHVIDKIKTRLASDEGFTLIELLVVIVILGILVAIAVPAYLSFRGSANDAAAKSNVRSAVPAAEGYYQANTGTANDADSTATTVEYAGMTIGLLTSLSPGVDKNLTVIVSTDGKSYCLQGDNNGAGQSYYYVGGADAATVTDGGSVQQGTCPTLT